MLFKKLVSSILLLIISIPCWAGSVRHIYNHSNVDWIVSFIATANSPLLNIMAPCHMDNDRHVTCTIKALTTAEIEYNYPLAVAITDPAQVSHTYVYPGINNSNNIHDMGNTGNAVSLNLPADGDISINGDSWGATASAGTTRHIYNNSNAEWIVTLGNASKSMRSLSVIHPPCALDNNGYVICTLKPFTATEVEYYFPFSLVITDDKKISHTYSYSRDSVYIRHNGNTGAVVLNDPADGDIRMDGDSWSTPN